MHDARKFGWPRPRILRTLALLGIVSAPGLAEAQGARSKAVLIFADGRVVDAGHAASLLDVARHGLAAKGIDAVDVPAFATPRTLDDTLDREVRDIGAERLFILQATPAGVQFQFQIEERGLDLWTIIGTASELGAFEDAPRILPRLIDVVLTPKPHRDSNVHHFVLGVLWIQVLSSPTGGSFGDSLGYMYENDVWDLGFDFFGGELGSWDAFGGDIYSDYFIQPGPWSPYVGLGLGFIEGGTLFGLPTAPGMTLPSQSGVTAAPEVGIEVNRQNHLRLRFAVQGVLPIATFGGTPWVASALFHASVAF